MRLWAHCFAPRMRLLSVFVLSYVAAALAGAGVTGNSEFVFYSVVVVALIGVVLFMDRRVMFSPLVLWGLGLWGLMHMAGGLMPIPAEWADEGLSPVLYNYRPASWLPKYDQFVHAFGFGVSVIAAWEAMCAHFGRCLPVGPQVGSALILIGMGLGAMNEVFEFMAVLLIPDTNVGGYRNTAWDLVSNLAGTVLAVVYLRLRIKRSSRKSP